jgi:hypothetical protein
VEGTRICTYVPPILTLALLVVLGCAPQPSAGAPSVTATPLFTAQPPPARIGVLELVGAYELRSGDRDFGGISSARRVGDTLYLLSDRSTLFEIAWSQVGLRGPGASLPLRASHHLTTFHGDPLDAEALAILDGGATMVGDESDGRVLRYARSGGPREGKPIRLPRAFTEGGALNRGLETLVLVASWGLLAILEGAVSDDALHPATLVDEDGQQRSFTYRAQSGFQVTDADVAGDWLLVLERKLSLFAGWRSRVVAVPVNDLDPARDGPLAGRELATISGSTLGENYEGLAASVDPDGDLAIILVSDNNFTAVQRTQLLELRWRP